MQRTEQTGATHACHSQLSLSAKLQPLGNFCEFLEKSVGILMLIGSSFVPFQSQLKELIKG